MITYQDRQDKNIELSKKMEKVTVGVKSFAEFAVGSEE